MFRNHFLLAGVLFCLLQPGLCGAQSTSPTLASTVVNGFAREITGEQIDYHSFHPYATAALLTRCLDGKRSIAWQTDIIPESSSGAYATFAWIAAYSTGSSAADARFTVSINGQHWFSFTTVKERRIRQWSVNGKDGATLSFDAKWEDAVGDLFGYCFLKVPVRDFPQGQPLTIVVVGDSANRRDWYMTFKYALRESLAVQAQPALLRTPSGEKQLVDLLFDIIDPDDSAEISVPGQEPMKADLKLGFNRVQLAVNAVKEPTTVQLAVSRRGRPTRKETVTLRPVSYREFWLLPHSHNDIGYSDLQADVEKKQIKNLRDAVTLFKRTAGYPEEARFKWNTEILWAVDRYLSTCTVTERKEFIDAVKHGGIGLNALYANQLTGICRPEELLRLTDFARHLVREYGVKINDAMITDIPGFTWAIVPALARGGIKYFSSGPNYVPTLPDGGDRVGHFNRAWGDRPFYWVSPSGQEKILFWTAGRGYSWFHGWIAGKAGSRTASNLFNYMRELEEQNYPYDMVQLRYTIVADNGPTDPDLPDFVKTWNEKYLSPKLVIATASSMFEEFERRWGNTLPSYAGDITPYWEDGALSTLRELGMARRASERLVQAEALTCMTGAPAIPHKQFDDAWRNVHLFDEHTWGAHNSVSEPDNPFAVSQWNVKKAYVVELEKQSKDLLAQALGSPGAGDAVDVINTASWNRTDIITLPADQSTTGDVIVAEGGTVVPSQRLSTGELAFIARDIPALGARRYVVTAGRAAASGSVTVRGTTLSNALIAVAVDTVTGALRSVKAAGGIEFVDTTSWKGLNQYLYVPGKDPALARTNSVSTLEVIEKGPVVGVFRITSNAPGCTSLVQELRIVDGLMRIELTNTLARPRVREKESIHFAFPMHVPQGAFRSDGGWGIVRPTADQLAGSCMDYLSSGRWLDVSNQDYGLTWTTIETPLVEISALTDETPNARGYRTWRTSIAPGTTFFSYVMNNYWHTNYAADQEGMTSVHYALYPHGMFIASDAYRRGLDQSQPLIVRKTSRATSLPRTPFTIDAPGIVVTSLKESDDGKAIMVRLYNAGGRPEKFDISWKNSTPRKLYLSSLYETRDAEAGTTLFLPAFGIVTLRCEK